MKATDCPIMKHCPIFKENVIINKEVDMFYKDYYCQAGQGNYETCKRYKLFLVLHSPIPTNILPDNPFPVEKLVEKIKALAKM
jgi:hypothetical protein